MPVVLHRLCVARKPVPRKTDERACVRPCKAGCSCRAERNKQEEKCHWWQRGSFFHGLQPGLPGGAFSLLRGMDLECFKPKFSLKDHTVRQENGFFLSVYCGLNDKKIRWLGKTFIDQKSVVDLLIPDPLGFQEDIKTLNLHTAFSL